MRDYFLAQQGHRHPPPRCTSAGLAAGSRVVRHWRIGARQRRARQSRNSPSVLELEAPDGEPAEESAGLLPSLEIEDDGLGEDQPGHRSGELSTTLCSDVHLCPQV